MQVRAYVFFQEASDRYRRGRTTRSLEAAGVSDIRFSGDFSQLPWDEIGASQNHALILRAGAWLADQGPLAWPADSETGRGLCALGMPRRHCHQNGSPDPWHHLHHQCGGNFSEITSREKCWPAPWALFLNFQAAHQLSGCSFGSTADFWRKVQGDLRIVHYGPLDVHYDAGLRVIQIITALQRGGAERLVLNLVEDLRKEGIQARLATLGQALRQAFPAPKGTLELSAIPDYSQRLSWLLRHAVATGVDLFHAHLLTGEELRELAASGIPLLTTIHNTQTGWPEGMSELGGKDSTLLVACAQAVEQELAAIYRREAPPRQKEEGENSGGCLPIRTVWNGIRTSEFLPAPGHPAALKAWRSPWKFGENDLVLLSLANPRPQKRLDRLPAILAAVKTRLRATDAARQARLVLAGEVAPGKSEAEQCVARVKSELARLGLEDDARWIGPVVNVAALLTAVDALICCSAHEGLSLAQLEALSMGKRVVATDVGGTAEVARKSPALRLVPADATPEQFADALLEATTQPGPASSRERFCSDFTSEQMVGRYRWLYRRAIARHQRAADAHGVWLITNNFSTGGAQSSARRLLRGLHEQGIRVRAAVVQEDPASPTPGCRALAEMGIPVLALPPNPTRMENAVERLLETLDADPPQTVLFWNLLPPCKILLADALLDTPVFDVSPGEMYFDSLERYFAKPIPGLPYLTPRDYGQRLAGVIVKYQAEAARAAEYLGAPVHVIPNGVVIPEAGGRIVNYTGPLILGTAARIHPQKRLEDAFAALRLALDRLPPCLFLIAGEVEPDGDDYARRLRDLAHGLPVEWLGEVSDMAGFHAKLDLFVMISNPAGCPNASLEAMAAGLPVIATDIGGASEQVLDGQTGRLVPSQDPQALAEAMIELATSPDQRKRMGKAAREHVQSRFSWEQMVATYAATCLV